MRISRFCCYCFKILNWYVLHWLICLSHLLGTFPVQCVISMVNNILRKIMCLKEHTSLNRVGRSKCFEFWHKVKCQNLCDKSVSKLLYAATITLGVELISTSLSVLKSCEAQTSHIMTMRCELLKCQRHMIVGVRRMGHSSSEVVRTYPRSYVLSVNANISGYTLSPALNSTVTEHMCSMAVTSNLWIAFTMVTDICIDTDSNHIHFELRN